MMLIIRHFPRYLCFGKVFLFNALLIALVASEVARIEFSPKKVFRTHPTSVSLKTNAFSKVFHIYLFHSSSVAPYMHSKPSEDTAFCHYEGYVASYDNSDVAFSLCSPESVSGIISINGMVFIAVHPCTESSQCEDGVEYNFTINGNLNFMPERTDHGPSRDFLLRRAKRDVYAAPLSPLLGEPSKLKILGENADTLYVRLLLGSDSLQFDNTNNIPFQTERRAMQIANVAALLMRPLNIVLYVVEHRLLTANEVDSSNITMLLSQIQKYRAATVDPVRNDIDVLHVLTSAKITDPTTGATDDFDLLGQAYVSGICSRYSVSFSADLTNSVVQVGATMAHEIGHLLGLAHDKSSCVCAFSQLSESMTSNPIVTNATQCIMVAAKSVSGAQPFAWSNCSIQTITDNRKRLPPYCLRLRPTIPRPKKLCGDGIVQDDEQCDCGSQDLVNVWSDVVSIGTTANVAPCSLDCCDMSTCQFARPNVSCATGDCCDFATCQVLPKYTECRKAASDCDLPEYCSGSAEYCPRDLHKATGYPCSSDPNPERDPTTGLCFAGRCHSRNAQCRKLWGPNAVEGPRSCYAENKKGREDANCGHQRISFLDNGEIKNGKLIIKCPTNEDAYCGTLKCINTQSSTHKPATFVQPLLSDPTTTCAWTLAGMMPDYGLVLNGTICKPPGSSDLDGICLNNLCVPLNNTDTIIAATFEAEGLGSVFRRLPPTASPSAAVVSGCNCIPQRCFCNSVGSRHCLPGWEPPLCDSTGCGGSVESNSAGLCSSVDASGLGSGAVIAIAVLGTAFGIVLVLVIFILVMGRRRLADLWYSSRLFVEVEHLRDRFSSVRPPSASSTTSMRRSASSTRRSLRGPPGPAPITTVSSPTNGFYDRNGQDASLHSRAVVSAGEKNQQETIDLASHWPQSGHNLVPLNRVGASPTLNHRVSSAPTSRPVLPSRPPPPHSAVNRPAVSPPIPNAVADGGQPREDGLPISVADARQRFGGTNTQSGKLPNETSHAPSRTPPQDTATGQWFNNVLRRNNQMRAVSNSPMLQREPMLPNDTSISNSESVYRNGLQRHPSQSSIGALHKVVPQM